MVWRPQVRDGINSAALVATISSFEDGPNNASKGPVLRMATPRRPRKGRLRLNENSKCDEADPGERARGHRDCRASKTPP